MSQSKKQSIATAESPGRRPATGAGRIWHPSNGSEVVGPFSADRHIGTALRETFRSFADALTASVRETGLSLNAWFLMRTLWERDGCSQVELARAIDVTPAAIVGLVNGLVRDGLVQRRQ